MVSRKFATDDFFVHSVTRIFFYLVLGIKVKSRVQFPKKANSQPGMNGISSSTNAREIPAVVHALKITSQMIHTVLNLNKFRVLRNVKQ